MMVVQEISVNFEARALFEQRAASITHYALQTNTLNAPQTESFLTMRTHPMKERKKVVQVCQR
jgi:hypothetical protein